MQLLTDQLISNTITGIILLVVGYVVTQRGINQYNKGKYQNEIRKEVMELVEAIILDTNKLPIFLQSKTLIKVEKIEQLIELSSKIGKLKRQLILYYKDSMKLAKIAKNLSLDQNKIIELVSIFDDEGSIKDEEKYDELTDYIDENRLDGVPLFVIRNKLRI